jgi:hypothetical protein
VGPPPIQPACTANPAIPPSGVLVSGPAPVGWAGAGSVLSVAYELRAVPFTGSAVQGTVELPSVTAVFPNASGGTLSVFVPPRALNVTTYSWSSAALATRTHVLSSSVAFPPNGTAFLTSQLLAVMASPPYGSLLLELRWSWNLTLNGQLVESSGWTTPTVAGSHPSIFYPQSFVSLAPVGPQAALIGSSLTFTFSQGPPSARYSLKLENSSNGATVNRVNATPPADRSQPYAVSIPVLGARSPIGAGAYLVHAHSSCGAILYSVGVSATFASSASIGIAIHPSACGPVFIDGSSESNGGQWSTVPSMAGHSLSAGLCTNATFAAWTTTGGAYVATPSNASTSLTVDASGSVTATYR